MDQQQQMQLTQLNSTRSSHATLVCSNSTSTLMLDEDVHGDQMTLPPSVLANRTTPLRSVLKTSGLFNKDFESLDKLNEIIGNGNDFTLHRLLSDIAGNDMNIDMSELARFDPMKLFEVRSISEFLQNEAFDQITASNDIQSNSVDNTHPSAIACSSGSFSALCPTMQDLEVKEAFEINANELKMEPDNAMVYTQLNSFDNFVLTPSAENPLAQEFNFDPSALAAIEHDYGYLSKRSTVVDTPSPSPITPKRTSLRRSCRTSSRLQSRAALIDFNQILDDNSCLSPTMSENSSILSKRTRSSRHVHRAVDIKNEDDLTYYLERRRKNNEASKMSRAARKQKFGDMDRRCAEYERVNTELRLKISTLEIVTVNLKNGLIHNFQRKSGIDAKLSS